MSEWLWFSVKTKHSQTVRIIRVTPLGFYKCRSFVNITFPFKLKVLLETSDTRHGYPLKPEGLHVVSVFTVGPGSPEKPR